MSDAIGGLFGGGGSSSEVQQQTQVMRQQQVEQAAQQQADKQRLEVMERAQKALRTGGRRGQMAFVDQLATQLAGDTVQPLGDIDMRPEWARRWGRGAGMANGG